MSGDVTWSAAARALFALDRPTAVSAGAGAGKTTALVELLLRLLAGDTPVGPCAPREVVAITFTDRAGAELSGRLAEALERGRRSAEADGDPARAQRLRAALRGLPGMDVGTIHGFAARLLRDHALDAGVDPDFTVLEAEAAGDLQLAAARGAALAALDAGLPEARALAAGHGGAEGLAALAAGLLRERSTRGLAGPGAAAVGDRAAAEAALAEVDAAARDLARRGAGATTASGRKAAAALEAALGGQPGEEQPGEGAAGPPVTLAEVGRWLEVAATARGWRAGKGDPPGLREALERLKRAAEALPGRVAEWLAGPQALALSALVDDAGRRYAEAKAALRGLDFDDLLSRARDLLRDAPGLRRELRRGTRALLVDEYQDVNGLQAEIFDLLAGAEPPADGGTAGPLLVAVGDAKQSIYRFRGADVAVFAALLDRLGPGGGGRLLHLRENHRSTPSVIELVNDVLARSSGSLGVPFGEEDRLRAVREGGARPAAELLEGPEEGTASERRDREAAALAARIQAIVSGAAGVRVGERGHDGVERLRIPRPGDVAILFRRLTRVAPYERALRDAGVPFRLARGGGFYRAPEVRDLGELCASLADPGDGLAWAGLLRSPLCGTSDGSLLLLAPGGPGRLARRAPVEVVAGLEGAWRAAGEGAGPPEGEGERLLRFLATWQELHGLRDRLDLGDLLGRAVAALDLEAALLAAPDGERRARNLRKLLDLARREAARGTGAAAFAARLRRLASLPQREPEADLEAGDAVAILSIHQAKGLEWPVVVIPDLAGRLPVGRARALLDEQGRVCVGLFDVGTEEHHETASLRRLREASAGAESAEARRLLYVALTRARDHLVLSGAGDGGAPGSWAELASSTSPDLLRRLPAVPGPSVPHPASGDSPDGGPPSASVPPGGGMPPAGGIPPPGEGDAATRRAQDVPSLRPAPAPPTVRLAVTALAEFARCPRRQWFAGSLGLQEPRAERGDDDPDRATERGTLAHAILSEVDLLAPPLARRALLAASVTRRGREPTDPGPRRILQDVERFLDGAGGRRLAAWARVGVLRREVPFLLRIGGLDVPACYLDGAVDALAEDGAEVRVVDFKYAMPRPGAADRYRLQLLAYALAAGRAFPGRTVRAELWFLRGGGGVADVSPTPEDLARFEVEAPGLAQGALAGLGRDASPTSLGRHEARCRAEGCGWVARCFTPADHSVV